jgi:hypothetical protein
MRCSSSQPATTLTIALQRRPKTHLSTGLETSRPPTSRRFAMVLRQLERQLRDRGASPGRLHRFRRICIFAPARARCPVLRSLLVRNRRGWLGRGLGDGKTPPALQPGRRSTVQCASSTGGRHAVRILGCERCIVEGISVEACRKQAREAHGRSSNNQ